MKLVPVNEPLLNGNEHRYLQECIDSGWISSEGPFVQRFEAGMAQLTGRRHAIAVSNGTVALEAAVAALGLGSGDEVILSTFTIISCAAAIVRSGATPVLVDCDPVTWNMDLNQVAEAITSRTKAIMAVHIYGLPVDMDPLLELAANHGLKVIEDAAEMHGQTYRGKPCGSFGDLSVFSFYPNKLVTTGEGGMLLTDDEVLADRCRSLRNLCFQSERRFVHEELGWNLRMSNLQAAVGVAQLERLDEFVEIKRRIGHRYAEQLHGLAGIELPLVSTDDAENIYWVYGVVLKNEAGREAEDVMGCLRDKGIGTRPFFWPMHEQPVLRDLGLCVGVSCPNAERLSRRGFYLPSGLALTDDEVCEVASALHEVLA